VLSPYYGSANLSWKNALQTLQVKYKKTLLYTGPGGVKTSGLDALAILPAAAGEPALPVANATYTHLTVDAEGLALNADGTSVAMRDVHVESGGLIWRCRFWTSDEYGPYIYQFSSGGQLLQTIVPPPAFLPRQNGTLNFTSAVDPTTGRAGNQGARRGLCVGEIFGLTVRQDSKA
jgi:hypothetical protein